MAKLPKLTYLDPKDFKKNVVPAAKHKLVPKKDVEKMAKTLDTLDTALFNALSEMTPATAKSLAHADVDTKKSLSVLTAVLSVNKTIEPCKSILAHLKKMSDEQAKLKASWNSFIGGLSIKDFGAFPALKKGLQREAKKEFAEENLEFLAAAPKVGSKQIKKMDELYFKRIRPGAPREINISSSLRKSICKSGEEMNRYLKVKNSGISEEQATAMCVSMHSDVKLAVVEINSIFMKVFNKFRNGCKI